MKALSLLTLLTGTWLVSCQPSDSSVTRTTQSDFPAPPVAPQKPQTFTEHGYTRTDEYHWLKDKADPAVLAYLRAENAYADTVLAHTKALQETLYAEMRGRIKEDDQSVPYLLNGYYYYTREEKDRQYAIHCRRKGTLSAPEEILLDENVLADGQPAFVLGGLSVSPDNTLLAYATNTTGSFMEFTLVVKDLRTGTLLSDRLDGVNGFVWANDSQTLLYTTVNPALRVDKAFRHRLGQPEKDALLFEEKDELFGLSVSRSKTRRYLFIQSGSFTSSETRYLEADQPAGTFRVFLPRQKDVQYGLDDHPEAFYLTYKDNQAKNRKVYRLPKTGYENRRTWQEFIPHDPATKLEYLDVFERFVVVMARKAGLLEIRVRELASGTTRTIDFPEPVYTAYAGGTPEFTATKVRYVYTSLNRPTTTYEYDVATGRSEKLKEEEIPSGFNPEQYEVKRLFAPAPDGTRVPMAVVHKKGITLDGTHPTLLYGYGSYGISMDATFNANAYSLVDRGFVYVLAQVRGGSDLGETWYEDGKLQKKMNSFTDFIACAEYLIAQKYTTPKRLAIQGGSAGGLLVGAVMNLRPELFEAVVAEVPFVDVLNTMLDPDLPLTTQEYEQWGNPTVRADYDYMRQYAPYENLTRRAYPNVLATGGLNDSQVGYHEPAKWVARLRALKTDQNLVLLKTNLDSGHGGATGRFEYLREEAFIQAFLLDRIGTPD
jgi:oligopeptidase B